MDLNGLAIIFCGGEMEEKDMSDKDDKTDVVGPYTTLHVHRTTRDRMRKLRGKGISADRYINDLLDMIYPEQKEREKDE